MLIRKDLKITINNGTSALDQELILFQNDRNIDIYFEITNLKFDFLSATQMEVNVIEEIGATYSVVKILKPNGDKFISNKLNLVNSKVLFTITREFIDSIEEIGTYSLQIQLYDESEGRITIPPVEFTVFAPIFEEDIDLVDGQVDITNIGKSKIASTDIPTILAELSSRKSGFTDWKTGDLISSNRMNLIHSNIDDLWTAVDSIGADTIEYHGDNCNTVAEALDLLLYTSPTVNSFTASVSSTVPLGRTIDTVTFYWTYNKTIRTQTFNGAELDNSLRTYTYTDRFNSNRTFTIVGNDGTNSCSRSLTFSFMNYVYWGVSTNENYTETMIKSLSNNTLSNSRARTITLNALSGQYIYYAYPSRLGDSTYRVGGFEGGFSKISLVSVSNAYGYIENYYLYKSDNPSLGNTTVVIS